MDRRGFFKAAAALVVASRLPIPKIAESAPLGEFVSIDAIKRAADALKENTLLASGGDYIIFCHPDVERDIRRITAKQEWKAAYRRARMELKKMFGDTRQTEFGSVESMRFVVSKEVPA